MAPRLSIRDLMWPYDRLKAHPATGPRPRRTYRYHRRENAKVAYREQGR